MKGYNGAPNTVDTATSGGKRSVAIHLQDIVGAHKEKYAAYKPNLIRVDYKLSYNTSTNKGVRLFTWNTLAKRVYGNCTSYSEKELKKTDGLISANGWDRLATDREKIIAVENYLKKNFTTREDIDLADAENIEMIIKNKIASFQGMMRLYGAVYEKLGVEHQFVLTSDREETVLDRSFENWNVLAHSVLYFPSTGKFLAPTLLETRYPWINPYWGDCDALFCKGTTIGNFTTAIADIRKIKLEDYTQSYSKMDTRVSFDPARDSLVEDLTQRYGGYEGAEYRSGYIQSAAEGKRIFIKEMVRFTTSSEHILSSEVLNSDFESYNDTSKPFTIHAMVKGNELLERAGSKILVRVGELIGQQSEMYQEKSRHFPVQMEFPHFEERNIDLTIPDGYRIKNLDDLNMHIAYADKGDTTMGFHCSYHLEGNTVMIHIMEEYHRVTYPLSEYEDFKKVINASADFNKVVLVFEKTR